MIPVTIFEGETVALFGLGGSGLISAAALIAGGCDVIAWDDNPASVENARDQGIYTANLREIDWSSVAALVLAPGVPLTHPTPHWSVELASAANVPVLGDIELFARQLDHYGNRSPFIAITGTNGKSTTTALIAHILKSAGRDVQMGGNIGRAVLDLDPLDGESPENRIYVVECSSYQIDLAPSLKPNVGILLNISPDHLERHGTLENYAAIKARLVSSADLAVVGIDDVHCSSIADEISAAGTPLQTISAYGSNRAVLCFDYGILQNDDKETVANLSDIGSLRGQHNGQNAAAAFAACQAVGLSNEEIQIGLSSFPGLAHRMEQIGEADGVLFINDSKATNAEAAAPALSSFEKVRWIAGGLAKKGGIESLFSHFERVEKAYFIGEAAPFFASQFSDTIPYEISGTLQEAVNHAAADARREGIAKIVLLSPAAASFDQFPNFEKRGEAFRQAVEDLKGFKPIES